MKKIIIAIFVLSLMLPAVYGTVFEEDFENGLDLNNWINFNVNYNGGNYGVNTYGQNLISSSYSPKGGSKHLFQKSSSWSSTGDAVNCLVTNFDIATADSVSLDFWMKKFSKNSQYYEHSNPCDASFSNLNYARDCVAFTCDGSTYYKLVDLSNPSKSYTQYSSDLTQHPNWCGTTDANFKIAFCHFDRDYPNYAGFALDDIAITYNSGADPVDTTPPVITLNTPLDGYSTTVPATLDLNYIATDANSIAECNLMIDGLFDQVDTTVLKDVEQKFTKTFTSVGPHTWDVSCFDSFGNQGFSLTRTLTITLEGSGGEWTQAGSDVYYDAGNVGIGKIPSSDLDVEGDVNVSGDVCLASGKCLNNAVENSASDLGLVAIGPSATASGFNSIAIGANTNSLDSGSRAIGTGAIASGMYSTAIGTQVTSSGDYSTALGRNIIVNGPGSFGIGLDGTQWHVSNSNVMSIMGGNVGIGIVNPQTRLDVTGTVKATNFIGDGSGLTNIANGLWTNVSGNLVFVEGKVGIGTIDPYEKLTVEGNIELKSGTDSAKLVHSEGLFEIKTNGDIPISISPGGQEVVILDSEGINTLRDMRFINTNGNWELENRGSILFISPEEGSMSSTVVEHSGESWVVMRGAKVLELTETTDVFNGETINDITTFIGEDELGKLLDDGKVTNAKGTAYYSQYIHFDDFENNGGYVKFMENDDDETSYFLYFKGGKQIARYSLEFTSSFQSDVVADNLIDYIDNQIYLLGKEYKIVEAEATSGLLGGDGVELTLVSGEVRDILEESAIEKYDIDGKEYEVEIIDISTTGAMYVDIEVNGEPIDHIELGGYVIAPDGLGIFISDIMPNEAGDVTKDSVEFYLGASKIFLKDRDVTDTASSDALEVGPEKVDDAYVKITGNIDGSLFSIDKIELDILADDDYFIGEGHKITEYMDEPQAFLDSWDIGFDGLSSVEVEEAKITTAGSNQYRLEFTDGDGEQTQVPLAYANGNELKLGDNDDDLVLKSSTVINKNDYFIISDYSKDDGKRTTYALRYKGADKVAVGETAIVKFDNLGTGQRITSTFNENPDGEWDAILHMGGLAVGIVSASNSGVDDFDIKVDLNDDGSVMDSDVVAVNTNYGMKIELENETNSGNVLVTFSTPNPGDYDTVAPTPVSLTLSADNGNVQFTEASDSSIDWVESLDGQADEQIVKYAFTSIGAGFRWEDPLNGPDSLVVGYPNKQRLPIVTIEEKDHIVEVPSDGTLVLDSNVEVGGELGVQGVVKADKFVSPEGTMRSGVWNKVYEGVIEEPVEEAEEELVEEDPALAGVTGNVVQGGTLPSGGVGSGGGSYPIEEGGDIYYTRGNVGIGTYSPQARLDVKGDIKADGDIIIGNNRLSARYIDAQGIVSSNIKTAFIVASGSAPWNNEILVKGPEEGSVKLNVRGDVNAAGKVIADKIEVTGPTGLSYFNGKVAIGKSSASTTLDVAGDIKATGDINVTGTVCDSNGCIGDGSGQDDDWISMGSYIYRMQEVGIGTSLPDELLQIGDTNNYRNSFIRFDSGNGNQYSNWLIGVPYGNTFTSGRYYDFVINNLELGSDPEFLVDHNTGNVGIGTTNPQAKLDVDGDIKVGGDINTTGQICDGAGNCLHEVGGGLGGMTPPCPGEWAPLTDNLDNPIGYFWKCNQ